MRTLSLLAALFATPVAAHEFWIEPVAYELDVEGRIEARLVNGELFDGINVAYFPQRYDLFTLQNGDSVVDVDGRLGDNPALQADPLGAGLHIVAYQSKGANVKYATFEPFASFAAHKDFADIRDRHVARGLPDADFSEHYIRFSKALIGVGEATGADRRTGLETEIVAIDNPYTDDLAEGMRVQVFYRDTLRADAQVELFEKAADGTVAVTLHRTDAQGVAVLPVRPGHAYLVDAVLLREPDLATSQQTGAVWETLWAALNFSVPD